MANKKRSLKVEYQEYSPSSFPADYGFKPPITTIIIILQEREEFLFAESYRSTHALTPTNSNLCIAPIYPDHPLPTLYQAPRSCPSLSAGKISHLPPARVL